MDNIKYNFKNPELDEVWKVHPSVKPNKEFQRMEFFGDKIISFILTKILIEQNNEDSEGEKIDEAQLSLNISNMVSKLTMSELGTFLIEDIESHEQINDKVSADCLEAFIGCVYKDGGDVESIIKSIWKDLINHKFEKNAKNQLQEWTQMKGYSPIYIFKKEENGEFSCELNIQGRKCITTASSKQVASIKCAELMMIKLAEKTDSEGKSRFRRSDEFQEEATDRRPRQEGGFSRRSEGGFDRRPRESSAGGFSRRSEGSFDRRPREGSTGGFSRRSEGGSFDRRPREGSAGGFSRRSEGGSFDRRPREGSAGGFRRSEGSFGRPREGSTGGFRRSEGSFGRPREGSTGGFRRSEGGNFDRRPREGSAGGFGRSEGSFGRPREGSTGGFRRSEGGSFDRRPSSTGGFRRSEGSFDRRPREGSTGGFGRSEGSFDRRPREGSTGGFSRRSEGSFGGGDRFGKKSFSKSSGKSFDKKSSDGKDFNKETKE